MQKRALTVLGVAAAVLAVVALWLTIQLARTREAHRQEARAVAAESQAHLAEEQRANSLERERAKLDRQNQELSSLATSLRSAGQPPPTAPAAVPSPNDTGAPKGEAAEGPGGVSELMAKMMKDPAMQQMIRNQQKGVMQQMYAGLFKQLNLTPEEQERFTGILLDNATKGIAQAGMVFQADSPAKSEALRTLADQQKEMNASLKSLLGDERYAQYEDYQKTLGERTQLNLFRQRLADGAEPLQEQQVPRLLDLLREEKSRVPSVLGDGSGQSAAALQAAASEETMAKHWQWQEDVNQRVLDRAGAILSPGQLKEYADFLKGQLDTQKMAMEMARKMFGGRAPGGAEIAPVPAK